ncbi:MAG: hypothetical protein JWO07_523 [Candidatus Saccharibacteria bacterium]|nr:hypothetical protein [Candidatus Saccharibacteria bacterium]
MSESDQPENSIARIPSQTAFLYTIETQSQYAEDLSRGELAQQIIKEWGEFYVDEENDVRLPSDRWFSDNNVFSFMLVECIEGGITKYVLDVREEGISGDKRYIFVGNSAINYSQESAETEAPSQEQIGHDLTKYLRDRYDSTKMGQSSEKRGAEMFANIAGRISIEHALAQPGGTKARVYAQAIDPTKKRAGTLALYELSKKLDDSETYYSLDEADFVWALPRVIAEQVVRRKQQQTHNDDQQIPITRVTPDAPWL